MGAIFTADDYGAYKQIDQAVITAVEAGKINSVAVLPNVFALGSKIMKLETAAQIANREIDIGCHLTFCSGKPLTKMYHNFVTNKRFKNFGEIHRAPNHDYHRKFELESLRNEIEAQIDAIAAHTEVRHLSCHHNTLMWFEDYFRVLVEVASEYDIPIRSPLFVPLSQFDLYQFGIKVKNHKGFKKNDSRKRYNEWKSVFEALYPGIVNNAGATHPSMAFTGHIGPILFRRMNPNQILQSVEDKHRSLDEAIANYLLDNNTVEFVIHIMEYAPEKRKRFRKLLKNGGYRGINHKSVEGRMAEMQSIMTHNYENNITMTSWN